MTRDDIAAVGDVIARSGMRNQLRAVRVFMGLADEIEKADEARRREIAGELRDVAANVLRDGAHSAIRSRLRAASAQETLPLAGKRKGRGTGPIDEGE